VQTGEAILTAAREADVRLVKTRLTRFERANRAYVDAQRRVEAAEADLHAKQARLNERDVEQDQAVDALGRSLIADGQAARNPFRLFGGPPPIRLMRLAFGDEAKEIRRLAVAIRGSKTRSKPTLVATQAAVRAAKAVEQAMGPVARAQNAVRRARHKRDALAGTWESALAALKRGTRAAADEGAPELHAVLFGRPARSGSHETKPVPAPVPPAPEPAPAPVAASS
jgi:hypothetical protein